MSDPRDDRVSGAYREMPGEGPSPALDAAIQAAARRAVGSRPGGARRWRIPVSIAAVLALAVGISLNVDREKPMVVDGTPVSSGSAEYPVPQAEPEMEERPETAKPVAQPPRPAKAPQPAPEEKRFAPDPPRSQAPVAASLPETAPAPAALAPAGNAAPPAAAGAAASADAVRVAPQAARRAKSELAREATTQEKAMSEALDTPERRLDRIADLRAKGLHEEADRALAGFRRAYPAYRLTEEWLRKVERR